jgi:hypothetical protein
MSNDYFEAIGVSVHAEFASYFDDLALKAPAYKLYRMDSKGGRYYYTLDKSMKPKFYPSLTHVIGKTLQISEGLMQWKAGMGIEAAEAYMNERAEYGTDMHVSTEELLRFREINLDSIQTREEWKEDLKKDLLSMAAFIREHNVVPLAIEVMLKSEMGFACTVDLVCKMDIGTGVNGNITETDKKKGTIETIYAIVDFKSGKKNFYESHEIQLEGCKIAWNESGLGVKVDRVFNWAPSDWRSKPTWKLKEQTASVSAKKLPLLLELFKIGEPEKPSDLLQMSGMLQVDGNLSSAYKFVSIEEHIARRHEK